MNAPIGKTADILNKIAELNEEDFNLLLTALDARMHDELDCTLPHGLEMFGVDEIRLAVKAAAHFARGIVNANNN